MKFTIRDLLLVTVIVAVCVAWWIDRSKLAKEAARLSKLNPAYWQSAIITREIALPHSSAPAPNPPKQ